MYYGKLYLNGELVTSLVIPEEVTIIKDNAFYNCRSIKVVYNNSSLNITAGSSDHGYVAYYAGAVITNGDENYDIQKDYIFHKGTDGNTLAAYIGNDSIISLPANYNGENYKIGYRAFHDCTNLTSVTIPNSVTTIGSSAFRDCSSLTSVTIPNSVTTIENSAFSNCTNLENLTIGNSVTTIGDYAFEGCSSLTSVTIPNSVTTIEWYAFDGCSSLTSVTIGNSVTSIGGHAFNSCTSLENLTIGNSVTTIEWCAFVSCTSLTSITIPNSVTTIGGDAFYECSNLKTVCNLSSLNIVAGSEDNGFVAYYADKVINATGGTIEGDFIFDENGTLVAYIGNESEIIFPADYKGGTYSIGNNAFRNNTAITSITIPASATSIGECAFSGCSSLESIYAESSLPSWLADDAFAEHYNSATLYVPAGAKAAYTATTPQREDFEVTVPTTNFNNLQGAIKSCNTNASYTTVNIATQNPDVTGILYGADYLLAYTNEKNASKLPSATFGIKGTSAGQYKIALVTAPWFIESYEDTIVTSTSAPKYRKSYLRVSVKQNDELLGIFPSDSVKLRNGSYGVLATSAITPDTARIDTIFLKNYNGKDFVFNLKNSGSIYETDLSNSIDVKVELLAPAYKRVNVYMAMNDNHYAHQLLLDQIMLVPVDDKKVISTVHWSNFANIVEMEPDTALGDITGDGEVNVADVTSIVAMILDPSTVTGVADITGDGEVNVADVTTLVSIILGTSNNAPARAAATRSADAPVVSASFDDEGTMFINVANPGYPFTAAQFDLTFEGGISVVTDGEYFDVFLGSRTTNRNHSEPECNTQPDGSLRVVILSLKNKNFTGEEGDIATINLDATGVADGEYKYTIKNIVLSDPSSLIKYPADVEGSLWVTATGIDSITADGENANEAIYDLSGRKVTNPVKGGIYIKGGKKFIM